MCEHVKVWTAEPIETNDQFRQALASLKRLRRNIEDAERGQRVNMEAVRSLIVRRLKESPCAGNFPYWELRRR
jgi:hypothetical protein